MLLRVPARRASRARLLLLVTAVLVGVLAPLLAVVDPAPAHATVSYGIPASTTQVLVVRTASPTATTGTLRAYVRVGGVWRQALAPYPVYVGAQGVGDASEYRSRTPLGDWALPQAFGRQVNPGTTLPYVTTDTLDWWDENPSSPTYNLHVRRATSPGGNSENLYRAGAVYDYAVVIGYNPARVPGAGSGIFLHVGNGSPTAGCVSMRRADLLAVMRWLRPTARPWIRIRNHL